MFKTWIQGLCDLVYPPHCVICKKHIHPDSSRGFLCPDCLQRIQINKPPFCPKCSRHLGKYPHYARCQSCRHHDYSFDFVWSACFYQEPLRLLIHSYKYHQKTYLRHDFALLMIRFINRYNLDIKQFDWIMPVPLFPSRLRERGYNQASLLAQLIGRHYNIPFRDGQLLRIRNTKTQSRLSQKERWTNVNGAFRIKQPKILKNKSVLILDDLLTTGATASEASSVLKDSGVKRVGVLTLATAVII